MNMRGTILREQRAAAAEAARKSTSSRYARFKERLAEFSFVEWYSEKFEPKFISACRMVGIGALGSVGFVVSLVALAVLIVQEVTLGCVYMLKHFDASTNTEQQPQQQVQTVAVSNSVTQEANPVQQEEAQQQETAVSNEPVLKPVLTFFDQIRQRPQLSRVARQPKTIEQKRSSSDEIVNMRKHLSVELDPTIDYSNEEATVAATTKKTAIHTAPAVNMRSAFEKALNDMSQRSSLGCQQQARPRSDSNASGWGVS